MQHVTNPPDAQRNFLVVDSKTENSEIERAFQSFTQERKDIAVLLINQHVSIFMLISLYRSTRLIGSFYRSQNASVTASTHSRIPSPPSSKSPAKTIHTTRRRTACSSACAGYSASKPTMQLISVRDITSLGVSLRRLFPYRPDYCKEKKRFR